MDFNHAHEHRAKIAASITASYKPLEENTESKPEKDNQLATTDENYAENSNTGKIDEG